MLSRGYFDTKKIMAYIPGGKHFGQYTYEHWFDHEYKHGAADEITIIEMKTEDIDFVSKLISSIFDEFVGYNYSEEGNKTFKEYIDPKNLLERYNKKSSRFYAAKCDNEIAGVLEIKNNDHISLFFVKKEFHKKHIGKKLFENYIKIMKQENIITEKITVNSSIYAETIYEKIGFKKTGELQEKNGIKFIPMEYNL